MKILLLTLLAIATVIVLAYLLIILLGKIFSLGNTNITSVKRMKGFLDIKPSANDPHKIAKVKVQDYYRARLSASFLGLVVYSNKEATKRFEQGVNSYNKDVAKNEARLAKNFSHKWAVTYHWKHVKTSDGLEATGTSKGEIHANNRADAQKVADTHGWDSARKQAIQQSNGALTDIVLEKAVLKPLKK